MGSEEKTLPLNLGSRLKTPIVPVWLVICSEQSGVLFSDDKGLLRDYQAENRYLSIKVIAPPTCLQILHNNRVQVYVH